MRSRVFCALETDAHFLSKTAFSCKVFDDNDSLHKILRDAQAGDSCARQDKAKPAAFGSVRGSSRSSKERRTHNSSQDLKLTQAVCFATVPVFRAYVQAQYILLSKQGSWFTLLCQTESRPKWSRLTNATHLTGSSVSIVSEGKCHTAACDKPTLRKCLNKYML